MRRILALILALFAVPAYAQQWDQVNGSMQVKSGPTAPLVIIDQTASGQKILSLRDNGTEVCYATATAFTCTGGFTFPTSCTGTYTGPFTNGVTSTGQCVNGSAVTTTTASAVTSTEPVAIGDALEALTGLQFQVSKSSTGDILGQIQNTSNTGSANAHFKLDVAGGSGGDPFVLYEVSGVANWAHGVDNSDSDAWQLIPGGVLGSGYALRVDTSKNTTVGSNGSLGLASAAMINTAPTVASGFGTSPSIPNSNGTAAFTINVGTGGVASSGVLTMPAASTGWVVDCVDITNAATAVTVQTAGTTTSVTLTNYSRTTGLLTAWAASDILRCKATAY